MQGKGDEGLIHSLGRTEKYSRGVNDRGGGFSVGIVLYSIGASWQSVPILPVIHCLITGGLYTDKVPVHPP